MMNFPAFKFFIALLLLAGAPLVWAEPVSLRKEFTPSPRKTVKSVPRVKLGKAAFAKKRPDNPRVTGIASWYSEKDPGINRHTANGEVFDDSAMTCADWHHPFGTKLKVVNLANGKSVVCRVNDRGPAKRLNRVIDLTKAAFRRIAEPRKGLVRVSVQVVQKA